MTWYSKNKWDTAKKTVYGNKMYDSKFEASCAFDLDVRVAAKEITHYDTQVRIPLEVKGYKICDYYIDFVAYRTDGVTEYIEAKGLPSDVWKVKWKLFEAIYSDKPDVELIVIWQKTPIKFIRRKKV